MNNICDSHLCTGCGACKATCSSGAISLGFDKYGFLRPLIDNTKCIDCKKCINHCPSNCFSNSNYPQKVYASCTKNIEEVKKCASGGIAYELYLDFLDKGIVYGTVLVNNSAYFCRVTDRKELILLKGSKYVSSDLKDAYDLIKADLKNGKRVLFIGLPCQVAGLNSVLSENLKKNLYTVDLICHGVPSSLYLNEHICRKYGKNALVSRFRNDKGEFSFTVSSGKQEHSIPYSCDLYMYGFLNGLCYRESCYNCKYAKPNRVGDITLGDFWGLKKCNIELKNNKVSHSLVLVNTNKGQELFYNIKDKIVLEEHSLDEAISANAQLVNPSVKPFFYNDFLECYSKKGFERTAKRLWGKKTYKAYIRFKIKEILRLFHIIK